MNDSMMKLTRAGGLACSLAVALAPAAAGAWTLQTLYTFDGSSNGKYPSAGVVGDTSGNLYGTTFQGGLYGYGVVFELAADGTYTVLHNFAGGSDGSNPLADLLLDGSSNLYGTTSGEANNPGTVFEIASGGTYSVLHNFSDSGADGYEPSAGLIEDQSGNLYGTTFAGGSPTGRGTIFKLAPGGAETILHIFSSRKHGANEPECKLLADSAGDLFGTTSIGGTLDGIKGAGAVFELTASGAFSLLNVFDKTDGSGPDAGLVSDASGNMYGTTYAGSSATKYGTVFKLAPDGTETVLHGFAKKPNSGQNPSAALVFDAAGNLYGTAYSGGAYGYGDVFEVAADGAFSVLYSFTNGTDGSGPTSDLILDQAGNLYGTTSQDFSGSGGYGTVFELSP